MPLELPFGTAFGVAFFVFEVLCPTAFSIFFSGFEAAFPAFGVVFPVVSTFEVVFSTFEVAFVVVFPAFEVVFPTFEVAFVMVFPAFEVDVPAFEVDFPVFEEIFFNSPVSKTYFNEYKGWDYLFDGPMPSHVGIKSKELASKWIGLIWVTII